MKIQNNFSIKEFLKNNKLKLLLLLLPSILIFSFGNYRLLITFLTIFSVLENSSFQIFGTLFSSNKKQSLIYLFIFVFSIFFITLFIEWITNNGRLDFDRLIKIEYNDNMDIKTILSPLLLFILTYKRIPVSSTFILLSSFVTTQMMDAMLTKTAASYLISFIIGYYIWNTINKKFNKIVTNFDEKNTKFWINMQLLSNIFLIVLWIMSNSSNFVVFLPRKFDYIYFSMYLIFFAITILYLVLSKGGSIQEIINEKKWLHNPKTSSIINITISLIMLLFQYVSTTPLATTWSFMGLLNGREFALSIESEKDIKRVTIVKILRDMKTLIYGLLTTFVYVLVFKLINY